LQVPRIFIIISHEEFFTLAPYETKHHESCIKFDSRRVSIRLSLSHILSICKCLVTTVK